MRTSPFPIVVIAVLLCLGCCSLFAQEKTGAEIDGKAFAEKVLETESLRKYTLDGVLQRTRGDVFEIFRFVRDEIAFDAYYGSLRGVEGTLLAGAGNSWDQAILLKALLDKQGIKCKMVRSRLPEDYFPDLLKSASQPEEVKRFLPRSLFQELKLPLEAGESFEKASNDFIDGIIAEARLEAANTDFGKREAGIVNRAYTLGDYLWVQVDNGEQLYDMHPVFPKGTTLVLDAIGVMNSRVSVPTQALHWVRVRAFMERVKGEALARDMVFEQKIMASTSQNKQLKFSLKPEKDEKGKILLSPTLQRGPQILKGKPLAVRSSDKGNKQGAVTGIWLEVTVLSPGERPRTSTMTLVDSLPSAVIWMERKKTNTISVRVVPDIELSTQVEMMLVTSGLSVEAGLANDADLLRRVESIRNFTLNSLSRVRGSNPMLSKWNLLLKPLLAKLNPEKKVFLNAPAVIAALYKPVANQGVTYLMSWCGILHFRTASADQAGEINGIAASLLMEKLAGLKDSLPQANMRRELKFKEAETNADIETLKDAWQADTWNELRVDLVSGHRVFIPAREGVQQWWKISDGTGDPILRGNAGWLKRWQVVESPLAITGNISGELFFFINNEINRENEEETITKALSRFISTHLSSFSLSGLETLFKAATNGKGTYGITMP